MIPTYQPAMRSPEADGWAKPSTAAGTSKPATTLTALELRAVLSAAAPRPLRAKNTAATALGKLVTAARTSAPTTMSATP